MELTQTSHSQDLRDLGLMQSLVHFRGESNIQVPVNSTAPPEVS